SEKEKLMELLKASQKEFGDTISLTSSVLKPMAYNPDTLKRKPDQWQPEYILKRYFSDLDLD
ncbi:MAG: choline-sulfatase, partial [Cyclobacteriaceae bacterium]|nr:choline-sulfatase [Cyclobacteriaceae bacterium]MDX5466495.1 choline-sulfatase [Cyclobacteriaceae bacterium]